MLGEFVFDAADVVSLRHAHMVVQVVDSGPWVVANLVDLGLERLADVLLFLLELLGGCPALVEQHVAADVNWVTRLTNVSDLIFASVCDAWVRHGVTVVPVG